MILVVFFFLCKVSRVKNSCFFAKIHHKQGFRLLPKICFSFFFISADSKRTLVLKIGPLDLDYRHLRVNFESTGLD